jgi:hypothetical protein
MSYMMGVDGFSLESFLLILFYILIIGIQATVTQQSTRVVATLRQMPFGERAKIKYAKTFVE